VGKRDGVLRGMTAGFIAAGVMSAVRLVAHRAGLIERMVPQVLQERVAGTSGVHLPGGTAGHQLAAEAIHHAVSGVFGALLGAAAPRPRLLTGIGYGLAIWGIDALGLMPALRIDRVGGRVVDAAAHTVFGAVLALSMQELAAQPRLSSVPAAIPLRRRVG
jgi:hypothetical protein